MDHTRLTNQPRPRDNSIFAPLESAAELENAVQVMREKMRTTVLGDDAEMASCGYLDITHGGVMNVGRALTLARDKVQRDAANECVKEL